MQLHSFFHSQYHSLPCLHFSGKYANGARVWLDGGHAVITKRNSANAISCAANAMMHVIFKSLIRSDYMSHWIIWFSLLGLVCSTWRWEGVCVCIWTLSAVLACVHMCKDMRSSFCQRQRTSEEVLTDKTMGFGVSQLVWQIRDKAPVWVFISAATDVVWKSVCTATTTDKSGS